MPELFYGKGKPTQDDDAMIDLAFSRMRQDWAPKIFYGGNTGARSILKPLRAILFGNEETATVEQYSDVGFFYIQVWVRTHGGFSPEFSKYAYVHYAMKERFSFYPGDAVDRAVDACLGFIFEKEPAIIERVMGLPYAASDSNHEEDRKDKQQRHGSFVLVAGEPTGGRSRDDVLMDYVKHHDEAGLANAYALASNKFRWADADEHNYERGTEEHTKACGITNEWYALVLLLQEDIFAILRSEGVTIPEKGTLKVLVPFMARNGFRSFGGWWAREKRE